MTMIKFNHKGLLKPQMEHSEILLDALVDKGIAVDTSPTGTGKTFCAAAIARALNQLKNHKFFIISPKLNIPKWHAVLEKFGIKGAIVINYEKLARGNTAYYDYYERGNVPELPQVKWSSVPYFLRGRFKLPMDTIVICDESHRMKGLTSLNSGLLFALKIQGYTVLTCSATQAMTPMDMRAFGYATNLHKGMHRLAGRGENNGMNIFKEFCEGAGAEFTGSFGAMIFDSENEESVRKLQAVHHNLYVVQRIAHRMDRKDFGDIFAHNQIDAEAYDMGEHGKKIQEAYDVMTAELAQLEKHSANYKNHIFAILTKARRLAELHKVPSLQEITEDLVAEGRSVIIFVNYQDTIDALVARLGKVIGKDKIGQIHGNQTMRERFDDIDSFQSNRRDRKCVMVCNIAAGAEAIDLHDIWGQFPRAELINPSYRAPMVIQAAGRPDRAGAKSDILTKFVFASNTIEDSVAQKFNMKRDHLDILNDGDLIPNSPGFDLIRRDAAEVFRL